MDFEQILRAFLSNAYKMTDGEIDALIKAPEQTQEAAVAALLERDKTRVSDLKKPTPGQTFQDGYAKAKKEVLTQVETDWKAKYGITSDKTGVELFDEIITSQQGGKGGKGDLTEDQVRKHPIFLQYERDMQKKLTDKETELNNKVTELETGFKKTQTFGKVSDVALKHLEKLNPIFPATPTVADTLRKTFLKEFKELEYEEQPDGRFVVIEGGKVKTDSHGNSIYLEDLVKQTAPQYFEFKQNNGGGNSGNNNQGNQGQNGGGGATYPAGIQKPTTYAEMVKIVNDTNYKPEDRQVVLKTWEAEQSGQK